MYNWHPYPQMRCRSQYTPDGSAHPHHHFFPEAIVEAGPQLRLGAGCVEPSSEHLGGPAQFVPGFFSHLRFIVFAALTYATAGIATGFLLAGMGLVISRASLAGDLLRHGLREHAIRKLRRVRS